MKHLLVFLTLAVIHCVPSKSQAQHNDRLSGIYQGIKWRSIGPYRGGRANTISGVPGEPMTYYVGYTGGGVWKTDDAGLNWYNISDGYFTVGSIGDIAVSDSDKNVIYVGSGEHAVRGVMTSYGDGVYKSTDGGRTWVNVGLEGTRHISDVIIHPKNFDMVYVGAQGAVHGPSEERGVYRSQDGGESWEKVLYIDENTGVSSLVMDKSNPRVLYAATWQHRRYPWMVESGGPGSSVYKSMDGGTSWEKITQGLPSLMGKIGLSVSAANPDLVFALVEAEKSVAGLYRSDDGGATWKHMSNNPLITSRSWYYMEVFADPTNEAMVYALNAPLMRSIDGGKTFESMRVVHGDCHDLWINPENGNNVAMAEDGGATITFNQGKSWSDLNNQPTAQIYRITADYQNPFWVYGGQQDNLSLAMPSRTKNYGILTSDWYNGPGCESAMVAFDDPANPRLLYGGCFNGRISLLDVETREGKDIMPYPMTNLGYEPKNMKYRFNWNAPLINDPLNPRVMYYGGNVLFKTSNGGLDWEVISPDLTRNDTLKQGKGGGPITNEGAGGENYNTIYYIAASPHEDRVIYTGSDCGMLHITHDGGESWQDITPAGLPETMIHAIEVSPHDPGTVYFTSTRYKFNDFANYSYKSTDYGASWVEIGSDISQDDFFRVVREDPIAPGILYAGAERGFYVSLDGGSSFERMQLNMPIVPITDLVVRHNDLAASTAGRGFWILDDLSAIQQFKDFASVRGLELATPKEHFRTFGTGPFFLITEHGVGENPQEGVPLDYYYRAEDSAEFKLEILDEQGTVIRTIEGAPDGIVPSVAGTRGNLLASNTDKLPMNTGVNRFVWDMRTNGLTKVTDNFVLNADYRGHRVAPGNYSGRLTLGDQVKEVPILLQEPSDIEIPQELWDAQQWLLEEIEYRINEMHEAINMTLEISDALDVIAERIDGQEDLAELQAATEVITGDIADWQRVVIELRQQGFQDALNWPAGMNSEFFTLRNNLDTYDPSVPEGYRERLGDLESQWEQHSEQLVELMEAVDAYNEKFQEYGLPALPVPTLVKDP